jgi:arylsulfatase A-like enzyme
MPRRTLLIGLWLACFLLSAGGCRRSESASSRAQDRRPNIVLITVCTFRYDHIGAAGYQRNTTPFLDALAAGGAFFENAVSSSSWTKPAVASILTGLTPNVHRMTDYYDADVIRGRGFTPKRTLADEVVTLAECLGESGYATACQVNNIHAGAFFNMTQGFDDCGAHDFQVETDAMVARFADWLARIDKSRPMFFFLLTRDPHITYNPSYEYYLKFNRAPEAVPAAQARAYPFALRKKLNKLLKAKEPVDPALQQRWIDLYDAELAQLDNALRRIPRVLAEAGRGSNTIVFVTADHGERFFEHDNIGHSGPLDEHVLHVPLIVHGPGIPSGRRVKKVVRSIDVYPTVAFLAGAEVPDVVQGTNLMPLIAEGPDGAADFPELTAFSSYDRPSITLHAVRDGPYKLRTHSNGSRWLYDLRTDPGEVHDLFSAKPAIAERMGATLDRWLNQEEILRGVVAQGDTRSLTPEVLDELRSLGYIE